jgi:hypothetical protein
MFKGRGQRNLKNFDKRDPQSGSQLRVFNVRWSKGIGGGRRKMVRVEQLFQRTNRLSAFLNAYEPPATPFDVQHPLTIYYMRDVVLPPPICAIYKTTPDADHYMSVRLPQLSLSHLLQATVELGAFHMAGFVTDEEVAAAICEVAMGQ